MRKKTFGILDEYWFYLRWEILDDFSFWLRWRKEDIKAVWLWTRVLTASGLIIPYLNLKEFFEMRRKKKRNVK